MSGGAHADAGGGAPLINQDGWALLRAFIVVPWQDIAARAYQFHLERGATHGFDCDDWLRAERELKASGTQTAHSPTPAR